MTRRWIIAAAAFGLLCPSDSSAQEARSRGLLSKFLNGDQEQPSPHYLNEDVQYYSDGDVQTAAAIEPGRPQAARESSMQRTNRKPSASLMSRFHLPSLFPQTVGGGSRQQQNNSNSEPPLPYDPAELEGEAQAGRPAGQPAARMASQPRATTGRAAAAGRQVAPQRQQQASPQRQQQASPQRQQQASPQRQQQASAQQQRQQSMRTMPQPTGAAATPRVTRSSPTPSTRRNELAEALAGLGSTRETTQAADANVNDESRVGTIATPRASESERTPSYLNTSRTPNSKPVVRKAPSVRQRALDVRDALVSEDDIAAEVAAEAAKAVAPPQTASAPKKQQPERRQAAAPRARAAAPPTLPPAKEVEPEQPQSPIDWSDEPSNETNETEVANGAEDSEAQLGAIEAKPAPVAPKVDEPPVAKPASEPATRAALPPTANLRPGRGVLYSSKQPVIVSNIEGPERIVVGRQAEYRVVMQNKGDAAAKELSASIAAPAWAEVVDASASTGVVERAPANGVDGAQQIKWQLYELAAGASQTLTLQLIPRSGREMQLGVQWTQAPVAGQATVEIQEPKLQMEITGPGDVLFGQSQRYALTLSNPGNGSAEGVAIELTPPGGDKDSVVRHNVGVLTPGQSKKIELELTAREAGELKILAVATATGDLRSEAAKTVMCRKPELEIDWRGPDKKYAGAVATYYLRVRNPGTAAAEKVAVEVDLPTGAELVEASDGHSWDEKRGAIMWQSEGLEAGEERFMQVQCRMSHPGVNEMKLSAQTARGDLSDVKTVPITVEGLADLKLEVTDPKGVVPVGEMAVYEIRIQNRGMTAAQGVNVVGMFSDGIDPSHVEGAQHTIRDGRVTFRPIESLPAGADMVLRIHAKATQSGTHIFRAEVACEELEVKLAAEETTRFFTEEERLADASSAYAEESGEATR